MSAAERALVTLMFALVAFVVGVGIGHAMAWREVPQSQCLDECRNECTSKCR